MLTFCNKREAALQWNTDWSAPIAYGSLSISDLIADSILSTNPDSSLQLVFDAEIYNFDLDELVGLPDTNLLDTFSLPFITPVNFSPGQTFINQPEENNLNLQGAFLKKIVVHQGKINYSIESSVAGEIIYTYKILSAKDANGNVFSKTLQMPAGSISNHSVVSGQFDLSGYTIELTGTNGNGFNKILTSIDCKINPNFGANVSVSSSDAIYISNTIKDVKIARAEGYFGQHEFNTGWDQTALNGFNKFVSGNIDVNQLNMDFSISNGIGLDGLININGISGIKGANVVNLNHALIGSTQQLNRAHEVNGVNIPSILNFNLNQNNSNITNLLSILPDFLGYNFDIEINPLGNISGYNDFVDRLAPLTLSLNATMPLSFVANNLALQDTISLKMEENSLLNSLELTLRLENGFPLSAKVSLAVLDQNDMISNYIFSPNEIPQAPLDANGKVIEKSKSVHIITISNRDLENLKATGKLILSLTFNSENNGSPVKLYDHYTLDYKMTGNANLQLSIGE